jgi:hypothetical protein
MLLDFSKTSAVVRKSWRAVRKPVLGLKPGNPGGKPSPECIDCQLFYS